MLQSQSASDVEVGRPANQALSRKTASHHIIMPITELKIKDVLMDAMGVNRTLSRLANEIAETNRGVDNLVLIGILTRGIYMAQRLAEKIEEFEDRKLPVGALDITLYRDDMSYGQRGMIGRLKKPRLQQTNIPFNLDGKVVVLVDDVLYTGRTIRAALDALMDFGRPQKIQLAVMLDRGHRELPVRPDFTGKTIVTLPGEEVRVQLENHDGVDRVLLVEIQEAS